jgi:membrane fusion protein (multidrug efflux system)
MTKIALSILLLLTLTACSENTPAPEIKSYQVVHPIITDTVYEREYATTINSLQNVEIRNKVRGFIEEIYVDEGQKVQTGQTLFTLNSKELEQQIHKAEASIQSAQAELKGVEIEYDNTKKLFEKNVVAKSELDLWATKVALQKAKLNAAKVEKEQAALHFQFTKIKAPFNGVINRIPFKKGSLVDEGALLTSISNNEFVYAYFNVSEIDYLEYAQANNKSNKVKLVLANNTVYPQQGIIETTESEFDASTGNIAFRAKFSNESRILKQGSSGKILAPSHFKNAILIPQKATFEVQGNIYVYVVDKQNKVGIKKINPVVRLSNFFVLDIGLEKSDAIILEGIQTVKEGDIIKPQLVQMPKFSK